MENNLLNQLEELIESHIHELTVQTRTKQEHSVQEKKVERMEIIMNQLSKDDKEWLDYGLVNIGCSKEEDDKAIYKVGFCDSLN